MKVKVKRRIVVVIVIVLFIKVRLGLSLDSNTIGAMRFSGREPMRPGLSLSDVVLMRERKIGMIMMRTRLIGTRK